MNHRKNSASATSQRFSSLNLMSGFIRQHSMESAFNTSDSWVILNPIEQSIKAKIEKIGKPLKEWDIRINYGIKTGCNEAFIIDAGKRKEILANCATQEERKRTDGLIRPSENKNLRIRQYCW